MESLDNLWKAFFRTEFDRDNFIKCSMDTPQLGDTLYQAIARITSYSAPSRQKQKVYVIRSTFLALTLSGDLEVVKTEYDPQVKETKVLKVEKLKKRDKKRLFNLMLCLAKMQSSEVKQKGGALLH